MQQYSIEIGTSFQQLPSGPTAARIKSDLAINAITSQNIQIYFYPLPEAGSLKIIRYDKQFHIIVSLILILFGNCEIPVICQPLNHLC